MTDPTPPAQSTYSVPQPISSHFWLGDWNRWIRDPIDVLRASYLVGLLVVAILGDLSSALRLAVTAGFVYLARWIDLPRPFDLGFVAVMALQGWGNVLGLFDRYYWYDTAVHLSLLIFVAPLFYIGLARLHVVPDISERMRDHRLIGIFLTTFSLGFSFGAIYEIYEYVAVHALGADLGIGYADTIADLGADAASSALGGLLLVLWASRGWATERRVPARRLPL
jgi:hypothetical protein